MNPCPKCGEHLGDNSGCDCYRESECEPLVMPPEFYRQLSTKARQHADEIIARCDAELKQKPQPFMTWAKIGDAIFKCCYDSCALVGLFVISWLLFGALRGLFK